jgi:hypothetical protein
MQCARMHAAGKMEKNTKEHKEHISRDLIGLN